MCHEDRAFLCRSCDASIHGDNEHVAQHTRFLLTGVRLENMSVGGEVGSKKRKANDMARAPGQLNDTFQTQSGATRRISIPQSHDSDFGIVPVFSEHFREQQVPEVFVHDTSMSYQNGITDSVTDAFEQEFLAGVTEEPEKPERIRRPERRLHQRVFRRRRRLRRGARVLSFLVFWRMGNKSGGKGC